MTDRTNIPSNQNSFSFFLRVELFSSIKDGSKGLLSNMGLDAGVKETSSSSCSSSSSPFFFLNHKKRKKERHRREKGGKEGGKEGKRKRERKNFKYL